MIVTRDSGSDGINKEKLANHHHFYLSTFPVQSRILPLLVYLLFLAFTFDLLPKSDDIALSWFHIPLRVQITFYLPPPPPDHFLCTLPTYRVALAPFHQKRCYWPFLCFYHTSPLVFRTFSLPPSATETNFTLSQFGQSRLL